jgi:NADH-quinone oxidoreductase subunit N
MKGVTAAVAMMGVAPAQARDAVSALSFYLATYLFMNLGAFAVTAFLRNALGSETIADYAGLVRRSPALVVCTAIILFSLVGLPPLAGFFAKFFIFGALVNSGLYLLLAIGGLNTVLSLFYYLRVVRVMTLQPEPAGRPAPSIPLWSAAGAYCALITVPLLALFVWSDRLRLLAEVAASSLLR